MIQLAGNVFMLMTFIECLTFVILYASRSPWRSSPSGRALMNLAASMALILGYAFLVRWIIPPEEVRQYVALAIYVILWLVWGRMLLLLRYYQAGKSTVERPNYTPFRDWWNRRLIAKKNRKV